jgi:hypothetical protein
LQLDYFATALEFYVSRPKATKQEKLRDTESLVFEMFLRYMNASALDHRKTILSKQTLIP